MNKEKQRIAIAKACGWSDCDPDIIQYAARRPDGSWGIMPDYLNDLNAMHEAIMSEWFQMRMLVFTKHVTSILKRESLWLDGAAGANLLRTPAHVLAEAFLRTLNLCIE